MKDLAKRAKEFLAEQDGSWAMLRENRALLAKAPVRTFDFDGFTVRVQLNVVRIATAMHKQTSECVLCDRNRPVEQKLLDCGNGFRLMCNPYPILPEHFTIINENHRPQRILDSLPSMLDVAGRMGSDFTIFYNGPQCGASSPTHLHFQAGARGFLPTDIECTRLGLEISRSGGCRVLASENYLRRYIAIESDRPQPMLDRFHRLYEAQHKLQPQALEPLMNVLLIADDDISRLLIFPRFKHRPAVHFAPEPERLLLSPGAVDVGGVLVVPVEEHFWRITREQIVQAFDEVTMGREMFDSLVQAMT